MKKTRKGFTLVEMMIVVLIIGILISIALPNFMRARENARTRACAANMKQIQAAIETWALETKAAANTPTSSFPTPAQLVAEGYLKTLPRCPSNGDYSYIGTNLNNYDVSCSIHGALGNLINSL